MGAGAKLFSGLSPQGPRPIASAPGPWNVPGNPAITYDIQSGPRSSMRTAPATPGSFNQTALSEAQAHHDRMRDLREKKQETLAGLMEYGQKDLGHFKKGAQQLNIGPQGKSEFKITPMMEERSYVSLEDPTIETIDQYERKRRRVV